MQVSVEKTSELSRKMIVSVPEAVVQQKVAERLKSLSKNVKIDGFRPGKAPQQVINKLYGERVRGEVTGDLIQSTYFEALSKEQLRPAGYPNIQPADQSEGFQYIAEFEVYPEISLDGVNGMEVKRPVAEVTESDVDAMIEKLRVRNKTWQTVERPSQAQDRITITFSGSVDGENFTDGKVENYPVEIGAGQMIPGFEDSLIGLSGGEQKTFNATFPENYGKDTLAGKTAEFEVEAVKVEESVLPEIDADFIKKHGIEDGDMVSFREDIRNTMERQLAQALAARLKNSVMDALYGAVQVAVPNTLIDGEIENLMAPYKENAKKRKVKFEELDLPKDLFEEQARRRVALGLILAEVIDKGEIKLDDARVRNTIEEMAQNYEQPQDVINWYYADEKRLDEVKNMVLEDQAVDWLVAKAKVQDENLNFYDLMDNQAR
ncbi:trigger factor [Candidatus Methylomicrobium oryzae]|uniref:trigger factor n=1 Tax=Candidatus Methylomicrobium oryzae TaxID=2802053 RepID=UPI0019248899|nr:trigger factor [Methylomicrobium sp. RS1]MBL1264820.1 trigger factor [Methylomicrobium sp. RS1]